MTTALAADPGLLDVDLTALATGARRVTSSDHALIVLDGEAGPLIAGHDGMPRGELALLAQARCDEVLDVLRREYGTVVSVDATFEGERFGNLHALKRSVEEVDHPQLLAVFAAQVGLALALARRPDPELVAPSLLTELDDLVLRVDDVGDLSRGLARVLGPCFGDARIGVMVAEGQETTLQQMPGSFGAEGEITASHRVSAFDLYSNSARVFTTGQPYVSQCCDADPGIRQGYVAALQLRRLLSVPLRRVGVLHIADKTEPFTIEDVERAVALAPRIANILAIATTLLRQRRQHRLDELLADVAVGIASGKAAEDSVVPALEQLCSATDANLVAIVGEDGPPQIARCGAGNLEHEQAVLHEAHSEPGMRAYVVGPQSPGDPGWAAFYVPVRLGQQRVGTLAAFRNRGEPFALGERRSLVRMANLAALGRAAERYHDQRAELARAHERQRIADDLHDDVAQILFAAQLSLDAILQQSDTLSEDVGAAIKRSRGLLIRGDTAIRTVIHRLSSPPPADLGARLESAVAGVEDEFSLPIEVQFDEAAIAASEQLRVPVADTLVKVARESLVNVAKHAGPCRVVVSLRLNGRGRLMLTVADDGRGMTAAPGGGVHHGLRALRRMMAEQGGTLRRAESAGGGTKVTASLGLSGAQAADG